MVSSEENDMSKVMKLHRNHLLLRIKDQKKPPPYPRPRILLNMILKRVIILCVPSYLVSERGFSHPSILSYHSGCLALMSETGLATVDLGTISSEL